MSTGERERPPLPEASFIQLGAAHEGGVYGLVTTPDMVLSGGGEGLLLARDWAGAPSRPAIAMPDNAGVLCLAVSPDAHTVLAGTVAGATLVEVASGRATPVAGPRGWIRSVAWDSTGWAAVGDDGMLWLSRGAGAAEVARDLGQQLHLVLLPALDDPCALTRDTMRRFALSPLGGGAPRWERDDFEPDSVSVAALSGHLLALAGEHGPIRLLDVRTGATTTEIPSPSPITALAWSGADLIAAHRDLCLRYFSSQQAWRCARTWRTGHSSWINVIARPSDGAPPAACFLTGGDDGLVMLGPTAESLATD